MELGNSTLESLAEIGQRLIELAQLNGHGLTVKELLDEFMGAKEKAGRSNAYLRRVPVTLKAFLKDRRDKPARHITTRDVETWLDGLNLASRTRRGYLLNLRTVFNFALRRGYLRSNPVAPIDLPESTATAPKILTPEQARIALETAERIDATLLRTLAIRMFAGLRSAETIRLSEADIQTEKGLIEIPALKSKTRARRLVKIQPCLAEWLKCGGEVPLRNPDQKWRTLTKALPFPWPRNAARHSFVSYHLAAFQNAGVTALEAGHTEQMLFAHYRAVVTEQQGLDWFSIRPVSQQLLLSGLFPG